MATAVGWWQALESLYAGPDALVGHTSLRSWLAGAIPNSAAVDAAWIASSLGLLIALSAVARRDPSRTLDAGGMAIPAMFSLWSLLSIYHNGNNMILMLPAFVFLWFRQQRGKSSVRWFSLAVLQATLMFDVPVRLSGFASRVGWARLAVERFDRVVVLATLVLVVDEWWRRDGDRTALVVLPWPVRWGSGGRGSWTAIAAMTANSTPLAGIRRPVSQTLCTATAISPQTAPTLTQKIGVRSAAERSRDQNDRRGEDEQRGHRDQQTALGKQLEVFVVRVVEKELTGALLVAEHRTLKRAGANTGPSEIGQPSATCLARSPAVPTSLLRVSCSRRASELRFA